MRSISVFALYLALAIYFSEASLYLTLWRPVFILQSELSDPGITSEVLNGEMSELACSVKATRANTTLFCLVQNVCHISDKIVDANQTFVLTGSEIECYVSQHTFTSNKY